MQGNVLYPLNTLRQVFPSVYEIQVQKYKGRGLILERLIPSLCCLWNDVLHLTPVHPRQLQKALVEAGFDVKGWQWFQIDPAVAGFTPENTTIYLYSPDKRDPGNFDKPLADFVPFSRERLAEVEELPAATRRYYRQMKEEGKRPLLFHLVPHILHHGNINVQDVAIINV